MDNEAATPSGSGLRILVVEDEPKVALALRDGLQGEGLDVTLAATGEEGFFLATSQPFDVLVLDRVLPGRDGLEILRVLRSKGMLTPVLMLTGRASVEDRVAGLDAGADDYLVKPFALPELLARVRALSRRSRGDQLLRLTVADLVMDIPDRRAVRGDRPLELTSREFDLLAYLVRNKGGIVSREMLARDVWQEPMRGTSLDNVIDVHIARLRKKIDPEGSAPLIHTIRGVGFIARDGQP